MELWETEARSDVLTAETCSERSSVLTSGEATRTSRKRAVVSSLSCRSRFFANVVGCQSGSSRLGPTNERNCDLSKSLTSRRRAQSGKIKF